MAKDLYAVLGVARDADEDTIKKAFRKLAMKYHPDKSPGKASEQRFKDVNQAHEVLSRPEEARALRRVRRGEPVAELRRRAGPRHPPVRRRRGRARGRGRRRRPGFDVQDIFGGGGGGGGDFGDLFGDLFNRARGGGRGRAAARRAARTSRAR